MVDSVLCQVLGCILHAVLHRNELCRDLDHMPNRIVIQSNFYIPCCVMIKLRRD